MAWSSGYKKGREDRSSEKMHGNVQPKYSLHCCLDFWSRMPALFCDWWSLTLQIWCVIIRLYSHKSESILGVGTTTQSSLPSALSIALGTW